jgi:hypothetical protein
MSSLTFKRLKTGPFQGIDAANPIIIEFPPMSAKAKKRPITRLSGDQGLGKSSLLNSLLYGLGYNFGIKQEHFLNLDSGKTISGELEFDRDGETWKVRYSKTKFELFRLFRTDDDSAWLPQGEAKTQLKRLVGNVAVTPLRLQVEDGKKQVDYLFDMLNIPEDIRVKAKALSAQIEIAAASRAKANKEYTFLKKALEEDPMYQNYEATEAMYRERKTLDSVQAKLDAAQREKTVLIQAREKLAGITQKSIDKKAEIKDLEERLARAKEEQRVLVEAETKGKAYVAQAAHVEEHYESVYKEFTQITDYQVQQRRWDAVKQQAKDMNDYQELVKKADVSKDNLVNKKRLLLKNVLPDIEGLEVVTEDAIDGAKTGVYLNGKNPLQLSESELFDLYLKLCRSQGVTMVVIENITSFGSDVIETLNTLAKSGVYVWATEMRRGQKELKIEFINELD